MSKRIYTVTAATGRVGSRVTRGLLDAGHHVNVIGRNPERLKVLADLRRCVLRSGQDASAVVHQQGESCMRIGIIGASGNIGSRVLAEARGRGHEVIAFTRQGAAGRPKQQGVEWRDLDIFDIEGVTRAIQRLDVLVSSYYPGNSAEDVVDAIRQAIADPTVYARAAKVMLKALESRPATRLIVVGGAANLEIAPGKTTDDDEPRLREVLKSLGVPEDYVVAARGHRDALHALRISNRRWTYATPSAEIRAGERTGRFRVGGDQLLFDDAGRSAGSYGPGA